MCRININPQAHRIEAMPAGQLWRGKLRPAEEIQKKFNHSWPIAVLSTLDAPERFADMHCRGNGIPCSHTRPSTNLPHIHKLARALTLR